MVDIRSSFGFSPLTCLELVDSLTTEQLTRECEYLLPKKPVTRKGKEQVKVKPREALRAHLTKLANINTDALKKTIEDLTNTISRHTEEAEEQVDGTRSKLAELQKEIEATHSLIAELKKATSTSPAPASPRPSSPGINSNEPGTVFPFVTVADVSLEEFSLERLDEDVKYDRNFASRRVAYYGMFPYSYPGGHHKPRDLTEAPYLNTIVESMKEKIPDLDFNSVMVTIYDSPTSSIPPHSDDEDSIAAGSNITTLSLGVTRQIIFRRKPPAEYEQKVLAPRHGSVYVMTRESQDEWEHGVPSVSNEEYGGPRISVTLRLLEDPAKRTRNNTRSAKSPNNRPKRVLILSDSKNRSFDCSLFREPVIAFRKDLFHLRNLEDHTEVIKQSDVVLISAGVNDLRRDRADPLSLHDYVKHFTPQFPQTQFIFDAVSPVSLKSDPYYSLNNSINRLNLLLFQLSLRSKNFKLFDNLSFGIAHLARDGLHFNDQGKEKLSMCWVHAVLVTLNYRTGPLPLRQPFINIYLDYTNGAG
jgi:alkylated DNA repair dioxygenase AlkB